MTIAIVVLAGASVLLGLTAVRLHVKLQRERGIRKRTEQDLIGVAVELLPLRTRYFDHDADFFATIAVRRLPDTRAAEDYALTAVWREGKGAPQTHEKRIAISSMAIGRTTGERLRWFIADQAAALIRGEVNQDR